MGATEQKKKSTEEGRRSGSCTLWNRTLTESEERQAKGKKPARDVGKRNVKKETQVLVGWRSKREERVEKKGAILNQNGEEEMFARLLGKYGRGVRKGGWGQCS